MSETRLVDQIMRLVRAEVARDRTRLVYLGSDNRTSETALGEPRGGDPRSSQVLGFLAQQKIVYDTSEAGWQSTDTVYTPPSMYPPGAQPTLLDNLNRIRGRIKSLETSGGTGFAFWGASQPSISVSSGNTNVSGTGHSHLVSASADQSNGGSSLLKTDAGGILSVLGLQVKFAPDPGGIFGVYPVLPGADPDSLDVNTQNYNYGNYHTHKINAHWDFLFQRSGLVRVTTDGEGSPYGLPSDGGGLNLNWLAVRDSQIGAGSVARIGKLAGTHGYASSSPASGVALGLYSKSSIVVDPELGLRVLRNGTAISQWDIINNQIVVGENAVGRNRIVIADDAIRFLTRSAAGDTEIMKLDSSGNILINYTQGISGSKIDYFGNADFNNIVARGAITSSVFTYQQIQASSGSVFVGKFASKLKSNAMLGGSHPAGSYLIPGLLLYGTTAFSNVLDVDDPPGMTHAAAGTLWAVNDILRLRDGLSGDVTLVIASKADMTTYWRLTCNVLSGSPYLFLTGTAVVNYGANNQGLLYMTADDANAPFFSVRKLTTSGGPPPTAHTLTELVRMGNLKGNWDYASDTFGFALGRYNVAGKNSLTFDETLGIRIISGATVIGHWQADGDFLLGTDTSLPASTRVALFNAAQTYNGESIGAGDVLLGDNTSGKPNLLWDLSAGQIQLRTGAVVHSYLSALGEFMAGDGSVRIDKYGLRGELHATVQARGVLHALGGSAIVLNAGVLYEQVTTS